MIVKFIVYLCEPLGKVASLNVDVMHHRDKLCLQTLIDHRT